LTFVVFLTYNCLDSKDSLAAELRIWKMHVICSFDLKHMCARCSRPEAICEEDLPYGGCGRLSEISIDALEGDNGTWLLIPETTLEMMEPVDPILRVSNLHVLLAVTEICNIRLKNVWTKAHEGENA